MTPTAVAPEHDQSIPYCTRPTLRSTVSRGPELQWLPNHAEVWTSNEVDLLGDILDVVEIKSHEHPRIADIFRPCSRSVDEVAKKSPKSQCNCRCVPQLRFLQVLISQGCLAVSSFGVRSLKLLALMRRCMLWNDSHFYTNIFFLLTNDSHSPTCRNGLLGHRSICYIWTRHMSTWMYRRM